MESRTPVYSSAPIGVLYNRIIQSREGILLFLRNNGTVASGKYTQADLLQRLPVYIMRKVSCN